MRLYINNFIIYFADYPGMAKLTVADIDAMKKELEVN